jgi:hypothetical protein
MSGKNNPREEKKYKNQIQRICIWNSFFGEVEKKKTHNKTKLTT